MGDARASYGAICDDGGAPSWPVDQALWLGQHLRFHRSQAEQRQLQM